MVELKSRFFQVASFGYAVLQKYTYIQSDKKGVYPSKMVAHVRKGGGGHECLVNLHEYDEKREVVYPPNPPVPSSSMNLTPWL